MPNSSHPNLSSTSSHDHFRQQPRACATSSRSFVRRRTFGFANGNSLWFGGRCQQRICRCQNFPSQRQAPNHPLIVHVASANSVHQFASAVPDFAQKLMSQFWPGPLTLILPRREEMAAAAAGGQNSVGLRCPSHPLALEVLKACAAKGVWGLAAPSANLFGRVSPTSAAHVQSEFGDSLLILDGVNARLALSRASSIALAVCLCCCVQGKSVALKLNKHAA